MFVDLCILEKHITAIFAYIGFNIATFAFLCQYLNFPRSVLADLSNMRDRGFPRIVHTKLGADHRWKQIWIYFFENDLITYAILMYILFSILVAVSLLALVWQIVPSCLGLYAIVFSFVVYVILRFYVVLRGMYLYQPLASGKRERRGEPYWTLKEKRRSSAIELVITIGLALGMVYSLCSRQGAVLLTFLLVVLVIFLAWYLWATLNRGPVTNLLGLWSYLGEKDAQRYGVIEMKLELDRAKIYDLIADAAKSAAAKDANAKPQEQE
jgi:hypothetical protein